MQERVSVHRLSKKAERALFQIEGFGVFVGLPRDDDNRDCAFDTFHMLQKAESEVARLQQLATAGNCRLTH